MKKNYFIYKKKRCFIVTNGEVKKRSPSNIALIKYWGKKKKKIQIPLNSSISYSLGDIYTETKLIYHIRKKKNL
ncbi:hypothetical protein [Blattabacterium cuenoti]|uniref:hypothetical protein n=1 Tax=Blattabacterium cuenoti TaxID=1653831 RepID=UPI001EEAE7D2|nr:hypothetical protein [Blattabacterium cuenoti]